MVEEAVKRKEIKFLGIPLAREMLPGESNMFMHMPGEEEEVVAKKGPGMKKGGVVKAASRGNGCAIRGQTKGKNR